MTMDVPWLLTAFGVGFGIGCFYFGGLWLTVDRLSQTRHPALLTLVSFLVRAGVTVAGFYLIMGGRWERLVACFVGWMVARQILVRRWRKTGNPEQDRKEIRTWT